MSVLEFKPVVKPECYCFQCSAPMKKRMESNSPAFCSYECGARGQPDNAKPAMRMDRSGNNPKIV